MRWTQLGWALGVAFLATSVVRAELTPDEVGIIALLGHPDSRKIAEHYAEARKIPKNQILVLEMPPGEVLARDVWEAKTRPTIRGWLKSEGFESKLRCLVTCTGVPLKIGRRDPGQPAMANRREFLDDARQKILEQFQKIIQEMDSILPQPAMAKQGLAPKASAADVAGAFEKALKAAQGRIQSHADPLRRRTALTVLERRVMAAGGLAWVVRTVAAQKQAEPVTRIEQLKGHLLGLQEGMQTLQSLPESISRDTQALALAQRTSGLLGALAWIDAEREALQKNETYASFDSELCLVLLPDYPLYRWQPNPLYYRAESGLRPKTLMVSRLAAPRLDLALKLVDQALAAEAEGLKGKFYLDARGMAATSKGEAVGSYGQYDESLRNLAARVQRHSQMPVVLDNKAELFQPGTCPDAALYCGWYSLAKYIDAFEWNRGAVGYHLASSEAQTLTTPGNQAWCNAMLEHGITATLGPTYEPYLISFPLPDEFFSLLLTGRYPLAEVYYRTCRFTSWVMVLVGDPLYTPFRKNPVLKEEDLPERLRGTAVQAVEPQPLPDEPAPEAFPPGN